MRMPDQPTATKARQLAEAKRRNAARDVRVRTGEDATDQGSPNSCASCVTIDPTAPAQLYTEDGAVMPPNAPAGKGRAAIQQAWASMLRTPGLDLTFAPEQIIISKSGDMALDRGTYRLTIAPGGKLQRDTGKYVVVWRKVGGSWKAAADIFNSDLPPSAG
jgi:ketosteroid isomerase-like protein